VEKKKRSKITIAEKDLEDWLGPQKFFHEVAERVSEPGVVTGLAWTAAGGDILFIEAVAFDGKGELKLTGQMGDVMIESARIALTHVKKSLSGKKGVKIHAIEGEAMMTPTEWFQKHDIHLHIPAGAVPKDGPSAGVTMATAILSLLTGRMSREKVAMTGELSLVGKVLPVGGIKEKVLAAKRAGVKTLILPKLNQKDLKEIPEEHRKGLRFHFASKVDEVFRAALNDKK
jgi:ATP-dependent Lon protease